MGKLEYEKGGVIEVNAVQQDGEVFPADLALSEAEQNEDNFYLASFSRIISGFHWGISARAC